LGGAFSPCIVSVVKTFRIDAIWEGFRAIETACAGAAANLPIYIPDLNLKLSSLASTCRDCGLTFTAGLLDRYASAYQKAGPTAAQLARAIHECVHRLVDELAEPRFYAISSSKLEFIKPYPPFFPYEVTGAFPEANKDLSEAAFCYAFERNTACVFHLMRALEIVLKAFAEKLGAHFEPKNWGRILSSIEEKIGNSRNSEDAEVLVHLRNIKNAWRNSTMHVERDYDAEQAFDILRTTKNFMIQVAKRLQRPNESGS
jgi:hypothetical protein